MVEIGAAIGRVNNTTGILVENGLVCFNSYGDWLFLDSSLQLADRSCSDSGEIRNLDHTLFFLVRAQMTIGSKVRIVHFLHSCVGLKVGISQDRVTTIATIVFIVTIEQLLFSKAIQLKF